ncbi:YafY family transcriptional regulator [Kurthia zopfii]|uniref:DNA-binding transcriptional regulator YafY n=1 Tax=Kurthia zopfii TaxID=1650 RepID=A0A8B4Q737_9BACL|nr:YafY family protein [Kurthia zopfii]PWI22817.1 YafY family transcriptional regulator [Kurthia zopfii]TDR41857.1 putative DNA-binding transcriptional regulator YafY [Kurthia zopfii]STX09168.1 HTH domain [Kurthia zopfii]
MKISRLISIYVILMDKKRISAKELANIFEVSTRTIYRDVEAINLAGIPIYSTSGVGGGFEIMENHKMDKNTFSEEELTTLLMGVSSIPDSMKSKDFINTFTKIRQFIPSEKLESTNIQSEQVQIDFNQWIGYRNLEPQINRIKTALKDNKLLSLEYISHSGNKTTRKVEPYQLVLKSSKWYFHGYCYKRNDFRLFKLTRILTLEIVDRTFIPKKYPKLLLDTKEIITNLQVTIKLRVHESIMEQLLDYCDYESFLKDGEHHYIVNFPFIDQDYYYGILLSFGNKCECISPPQIRTKLKEKIAALARIYEIAENTRYFSRVDESASVVA